MSQFKKSSVRFGTITLAVAFLFNFFPSLYMLIFHNVFPSKMGQLLTILVAAYIINWIVQPLSYFGVFGTSGTYMAWLTGSVGDVRAPAVRMAQKVSNYEGGTHEGDIMATLAIASSTFVTMPILSVCVFIGSALLGLLPAGVQAAFVFILPAMYGAVYSDMMSGNMKTGLITFAVGLLGVIILPKLGVPSALIILYAVLGGMLSAHFIYKATETKNGTPEKPSKKETV